MKAIPARRGAVVAAAGIPAEAPMAVAPVAAGKF